MFDPSFFELIIICVVALLVLGPDRLPGAIKTLGLWIGRMRRSFNNIKREIEQEVGADEIRRQLRNEAIMEKFKDTKTQVTESIESIKSETESIKDDLNLEKELSDPGEEDPNQTSSPATSDPIEKLTSNSVAGTNNPAPEQHPAQKEEAGDSVKPENSEQSDSEKS